jgi:putative FmdB family regulatory protein
MPIYEYLCKKCGEFEVTQRITESALRKCPTCKGKVERILSRSSFVLKGSGWYATDYARKGNGSAEPKESSAPDAAAAPSKAEAGSKTESVSSSTSSEKSSSSSEKSAPAKSAD